MEAKPNERIQDQVVNAVGQVGAKISEFLSGNPLESDVGRMIVAATNADVVKSENWSLIMSICDYIIETPNGPRDALRAIKKQLADNINKNQQTILYTLIVLEAAVKNCGVPFASLVCKIEFLEELIKIVKKDTVPQVQEKILSLIQSWADAFRGIPECAEVAQYYDDLKKRGIEFPATDLDSFAPIITPKRTVYTSPKSEQPLSRSSQPGIYVASGHQQIISDDSAIAKIQVEIAQGKKHANSFLQLLSQLPPISTITEPDLLQKLNKIYDVTKEMRNRTALLVQQIHENQTLVTEILDCNDMLTNAINLYENALNPKDPERHDYSAPGPSSSKPKQDTGLIFDQTDAGLNVAAFNKTEPISDRVADEVEEWLTNTKKTDNSEQKKDDGL